MTYSISSSLSRALKKLWHKGLLKKCKPSYEYRWHKLGPYDESGSVGYYGKDFQNLRAFEFKNGNKFPTETLIRVPRYTQLPHKTHVWWILTEKGKDIAEEVLGVKAERRKRLLERCRGCSNWYEKKRECEVFAMQGKELTTEECE